MKTFKTLLVLGAAGLIGGLLFIYSGVFNVAADDPHTKPFYWLMETVRERSIAVRAQRGSTAKASSTCNEATGPI